jgi:molybdenum cofactor biosynthesis enzyme MoaA
LRNAALAALLEEGRFLKLNFVWRGPADAGDLGALLDWAATRPVVVAVLDDLGDPSLGPASVRAAVEGLRGAPARAVVEPDPCSLPTLRLSWGDGLVVEIKHEQLGQVAPWASCGTCPLRARCREGIVALRLTHEGRLLPCLDRPDLAVDLAGELIRVHVDGRTLIEGSEPRIDRLAGPTVFWEIYSDAGPRLLSGAIHGLSAEVPPSGSGLSAGSERR